ncbi:MAG: hypothetical protein LBO72_03110 [Helicobacteraceae bacterium]|jgi:hypothetical protein|nr:hypothetical protein [Helicobacteraceae bacterium]
MEVANVSYIVAASIIAAFALISASIIALKKFNIVKRPLAPYVITGTLFCMFGALIAIVVVSQRFNPAVSDRRYMQDYQDADRRFNQLKEAIAKFESLYDTRFNFESYSDKPIGVPNPRGATDFYPHALTIGKNRFDLILRDKSGALIGDANVSAMISSIDGAFDQTIRSRFNANAYDFDEFDIAKEGRYRVTVKIDAPQASAYLHRELYAR